MVRRMAAFVCALGMLTAADATAGTAQQVTLEHVYIQIDGLG